ncbi:hypothetical protein AGDE_15254 [Angomonas deanei]|uniref:Cullin protein neddylation domain containing protein, putative n=1 Tax=Angomonas deanei TaxID=59799 RepID=A0A7G2CEJ7_9TRYP|nr:hypothetical protein AGDE_15254 [Angomonas deanei]CAD2217294.1 Cullin protein neddylation domain containing protein, putative [Angomonas deanei]|eukprot:EPY19438.1 hypothetical protein AGDE_15254 [Angomonas deanei]
MLNDRKGEKPLTQAYEAWREANNTTSSIPVKLVFLTSGYWRVMDKQALISVFSERGKVQDGFIEAVNVPRIAMHCQKEGETTSTADNNEFWRDFFTYGLSETPLQLTPSILPNKNHYLSGVLRGLFREKEKMEQFYFSKHQKRVLRWQPHLSSAEMAVQLTPTSTETVVCGTMLQFVLLSGLELFLQNKNHPNSVKIGELVSSLFASNNEGEVWTPTLVSALEGLCDPSFQLLTLIRTNSRDGTLHPSDSIQINANFHQQHANPNNNKKIRIPQPIFQPHHLTSASKFFETEEKTFQASKEYLFYTQEDYNEFFDFEESAAPHSPVSKRVLHRLSGKMDDDAHGDAFHRQDSKKEELTEEQQHKRKKEVLSKLEMQTIKLLKKKKTLPHGELMEQLLTALPFLSVNTADIKKVLETLVSKGFIERKEDTYVYCP